MFAQQMDAKRQRLMEDYRNDALERDTVVNEVNEPISLEELIDIDYTGCFACEYLSSDALAENEDYLYLMKLYTENASSMRKEGLFKLIKDYFDKNIKPMVDIDWTLQSIKEHFTSHTKFPTDELAMQLAIKKSLRNKMAGNLVEKTPDGGLKFNHMNIRNVIAIDKEIMALLKAKKEIPHMVGYNEVLDY